jgi:hypothetical protein
MESTHSLELKMSLTGIDEKKIGEALVFKFESLGNTF